MELKGQKLQKLLKCLYFDLQHFFMLYYQFIACELFFYLTFIDFICNINSYYFSMINYSIIL